VTSTPARELMTSSTRGRACGGWCHPPHCSRRSIAAPRRCPRALRNSDGACGGSRRLSRRHRRPLYLSYARPRRGRGAADRLRLEISIRGAHRRSLRAKREPESHDRSRAHWPSSHRRTPAGRSRHPGNARKIGPATGPVRAILEGRPIPNSYRPVRHRSARSFSARRASRPPPAAIRSAPDLWLRQIHPHNSSSEPRPSVPRTPDPHPTSAGGYYHRRSQTCSNIRP